MWWVDMYTSGRKLKKVWFTSADLNQTTLIGSQFSPAEKYALKQNQRLTSYEFPGSSPMKTSGNCLWPRDIRERGRARAAVIMPVVLQVGAVSLLRPRLRETPRPAVTPPSAATTTVALAETRKRGNSGGRRNSSTQKLKRKRMSKWQSWQGSIGIEQRNDETVGSLSLQMTTW